MNIGTGIRKDKKNKDGLAPIVFYVGEQKISAGEFCAPELWKKKKLEALTSQNLDKKKVALQTILNFQGPNFDIEKTRDFFAAYLKRPEKLDKILHGKVGQKMSAIISTTKEQGDFYMLIESILKEYKNAFSFGYKKRFITIRTKFLDYDPKFSITHLNAEWWRGFVDYCINDLDNVNNTISTDAKVIGRLIELARDKGYEFPKDVEEISKKYIEPEIMSIEWDQVQAIADVDLSNSRPSMKDSRTAWLAGAYTGRRWGEIEKMGEKNFYQDNKGRWRYKSTAKNLKPVDFPLLPEAVTFFKSIKFTIPEIAQQTVNKDIKDIANLAGITNKVMRTTIKGYEVEEELVEESETIHIHTGRHSYAMRIVDLSAGQPHAEKFVSFMLGHASHATTWKYMNRRASSHDQMFDSLILKEHAI